MATITRHSESLVERDEVYFPDTDIIDTEPFYKNFTTIQNVLHRYNEEKQLNNPIHSTNDKCPIHRLQIEPSSPYYSNRLTDRNHQIPSQTIDGYIFNLTRIVEEIGYNPKLPLIYSSLNTTNNNALSNIILKLGGAHGSLVNIRRSHIDKHYFQRWYLEKYSRSASMIRCNRLIKKTTQKSDDYQSNINIHPSVSTNLTFKQMDEKRFQNQVMQTYGFDDIDTISSISSQHSSVDEKNSSSNQQSTPMVLETIDNFKPKQQITIREYYPRKELSSVMVNRSLSPSSSQQTINDHEYEQFLHDHPELNNDPNPQIITKPNPDHITYQQNVSVRYLIPPTPPPPGPLIIREIVPPRPPSPPPLIIKHQDPAPPTPPPLILREVPPLPPPHQETKVITKILPQEPPSSQRVIIERDAPLPPKPQSIIIEKWLPYKPAPPREVIYERIIETPLMAEFQPTGIAIDRQRRHSADFHLKSSSSRLPIPVHIERQNSFDQLETKQSSVFDQFAWSTQQHLATMQRQAFERSQAHQQWITNQNQHHMNMFRQMPLQLTTPALIVNHPPVTRTVTSYAQRQEIQQQAFYNPTFMYPSYI